MSEKSYGLLEHERLHVRGPPRRLQARDPRRRRGDLRRQGRQGEHAEPQGQAPAATAAPARYGKPPDTKRAIVTLAEGDRSTCSRDRDDGHFASASPPAPVVGSRRSRTSPRSPRPTPEKSLLAPKPKTGGRNNYGRKTARHKGGGHKQPVPRRRLPRNKDGVPAKVAAIEYDPNRNCRIALLHYLDGEKRYILAPRNVKVGDLLQSGQGSEIRPGNALPLRYIPVGTTVHNVELKPGGGGKMARSAGSSVQLVAKEGDFATLRLPSTEMRRVPIDCRATVGEVGNAEAELIKIGKAGRNRWKGVRPQTRGVAMNPVDHPHGGGEGKTSGGRHPVSPWGKPEGRTRDKNKPSQKLIVRRRRTRGCAEVTRPMPRSAEEGPVRRRPPAQEGRRPQRRRARRGSSRPGRAAPRSSPTWSATPSPSTTAASTCPCTSPSRWSGTSSASSPPPAPSGSTPARRSGAKGRRLMARLSASRPTSGPGTPCPGRATSRISAYKAREVLDLIRGKHVARGRRDPRSSPSATSRDVDPQVPRLGGGQRRAQRRA